MEKKKALILTGGGDCPGLNAVIRAVTRAAIHDGSWEVWGSIEAFNGVMANPPEIIKLDKRNTEGIHVTGGTIIKTTNKGNPLDFPVQKEDGTWTTVDRSEELIANIKGLGFDAVINIGGDGSQKIGLALQRKGLNVIGVPKTIDNDLSATDLTFGFNTAVQIASESFDKLVTTAASHSRVMLMEVMGRDAGWIALHTAISGGAEICLIPEVPFDIEVILEKIKYRYEHGKKFVNIVVAEGAKPKSGRAIGEKSDDVGDEHIKYGGIANYIRKALEDAGCEAQIRTAVLGHIQRGGTPMAFDRVLATSMGVKAFEMLKTEEFGRMVALKNNRLESVTLEEATAEYSQVKPDNYLLKTARAMGMSFGDE
ncbi:MAG: 6-phosphofructokinase [Flavobacteriales bacterium]